MPLTWNLTPGMMMESTALIPKQRPGMMEPSHDKQRYFEFGWKHVDGNSKAYCSQPLAPVSFHVLPGPLALATHAAPAAHYTLHPRLREQKKKE
ncbi:hypothetical protein Pelo_5944 [Pelomyxa schiedti]|nr:hypothetical protein Pelo_5944 [Pelomyxa schiedti]